MASGRRSRAVLHRPVAVRTSNGQRPTCESGGPHEAPSRRNLFGACRARFERFKAGETLLLRLEYCRVILRPHGERNQYPEGVKLRVLFVCTGNICRSPTAERLASAYGARHRISGFEAVSAGTQAVIGCPMESQAALVLTRLGGDASNFTARQLTSRIASSADLILTMTRAHRDSVLRVAPRQLHKTFMLSEAARLVTNCNAQKLSDLADLRPHLESHERLDIPDPIGQNAEVYSAVAEQIAGMLMPILTICQNS